MTHLDLSPRPGAASDGAMVRAQALMELRLLARNGEQLGITLVVPLLLLVAGTKAGSIVDLGEGRPIDILAPGVLALAVLSASFTSLAIATGFERRYGVLKRLGASPLPRWGLLAGKTLAVVVVEVVQVAVLAAVAFALGWQPDGGVSGWLWAAVLLVLGTTAFGSLGLLIAGSLRAEATLAVANLVYVLLLVGGGVLVPLERYPDGARAVLELLPSGALGQGLRDAFASGAPGLLPVLVLVVWSAVGATATARTFRWE
ncbi:ABC transporter permease [Aeromicrobium sp. IC_218]|uniref:ABC transporter permease n=1 Tax=Aeromicrobium sp. IC_218 TaxID=2545468 RepID=UPI00103ECD05|nr:ABC transporter permease [Aeromicrobium sp. IC_218]TCJ00078.1 ABC transporter permease [Aeromicrobium sp. IC_218]